MVPDSVSPRLVSFRFPFLLVPFRLGFVLVLFRNFQSLQKKLEKILTQKNLDSFPVAEEVALSWCLAGSAFVAAK